MYSIFVNRNKPEIRKKSIATIGNFDGLHLGHLELLKSFSQYGVSGSLHRIVITFEPSPADFFADKNQKARILRLSLLRDKVDILKKSGLVDEIVIIRFNSKIANLSPIEFINDVLKTNLAVTHVIIGHDFKFGCNASGSIQDLRQSGIVSYELDSFEIEGKRVSSSLIRENAIANELSVIKKYLGRNLRYTSRVIYGKQLGRKYGVPTINLCLGHNRPALWGIYMVFVYIDNIRYNGIASIGKNPTVSDQDTYKLEVHLLDIDLDLYGKIATVEILSFLRAEEKFTDLDKLFKQIHLDLYMAREYFKNI